MGCLSELLIDFFFGVTLIFLMVCLLLFTICMIKDIVLLKHEGTVTIYEILNIHNQYS